LGSSRNVSFVKGVAEPGRVIGVVEKEAVRELQGRIRVSAKQGNIQMASPHWDDDIKKANDQVVCTDLFTGRGPNNIVVTG
jgi:hypothetical protein